MLLNNIVVYIFCRGQHSEVSMPGNSAQGFPLLQLLIFLAAACDVAPTFRKMGLGVVIEYLAAGVAICPFGLAQLAMQSQ